VALRKTALLSVVDDESVRDSTKALFRSAGFMVETFESGEQFLASGALPATDCLILDIRMTGMDGPEVQRRVNASEPNVPIIFISAHERSPRLAMNRNAIFFHKPFAAGDLLAAVQTALGPVVPRQREREAEDLPMTTGVLRAVAP
jgi:FixJ family two-component response regulator